MEVIDLEKKSKAQRGKRNRIKNLKVDHIALCDFPAVPSATFFIFKKLEDGSLDLNDPETLERLQAEFDAMTEEEKAELTTALEKLDATVTLQLMEADYDRLKKEDVGLCRMIKEFPETIDWTLGKGFTMKEAYKFSKTKYLSSNKKYEFDPDALKWFPVKKEGR